MNHFTSGGTAMLCGENLSYEINDTIIIRDLNLAVSPGEVLYIEGDNGAGKTILLRILCGIVQPDEGRVLWNNENINGYMADYYSNLTYIGHLTGVKQELTAVENLQFLSTLSATAPTTDYLGALAWAGLAGFEHSPARHLSYGQQRRLALARLRLENSPVWILDEPFSGLDQPMIEALKARFSEHLDQAGMLVLTSHQPIDLMGMKSTRILLESLA